MLPSAQTPGRGSGRPSSNLEHGGAFSRPGLRGQVPSPARDASLERTLPVSRGHKHLRPRATRCPLLSTVQRVVHGGSPLLPRWGPGRGTSGAVSWGGQLGLPPEAERPSPPIRSGPLGGPGAVGVQEAKAGQRSPVQRPAAVAGVEVPRRLPEKPGEKFAAKSGAGWPAGERGVGRRLVSARTRSPTPAPDTSTGRDHVRGHTTTWPPPLPQRGPANRGAGRQAAALATDTKAGTQIQDPHTPKCEMHVSAQRPQRRWPTPTAPAGVFVPRKPPHPPPHTPVP